MFEANVAGRVYIGVLCYNNKRVGLRKNQAVQSMKSNMKMTNQRVVQNRESAFIGKFGAIKTLF